MESINITVSRVYFPREDAEQSGKSAFYVIGTKDFRKACGVLPFRPTPGMNLTLTGDWEVYHGERNFKFVRATHDVPQDKHALLSYAASLTNGVGPKTVEKIYAAYGDEWQSHLDEMSPSVGIPLARTLDALGANKAKLDLVLFFVKLGLSPALADKAWKKWKDQAVAVVKANPYSLTQLDGVGFKTCDSDAMRREFGIDQKDARRAVAAVDFSIRSLMDESGNSVVRRDAVYSMLHDLRVERTTAAASISRLVKEGRVVFVGFEHITTSRAQDVENDFARYITERTDSSVAKDGSVEWDDGFVPDETQSAAVSIAVGSTGLRIINGGAGAGKTTIIRAITRAIERMGETVHLCAFAGKAAARLREATSHSASTIHSLLQWKGDGIGFSAPSLEGRSVIVDEASMIPSALLYEITKRNPKRLVLVGDQAQLQPVGIGSPFHDVIDNMPSLVNTLNTCYRNREAVFASALKIRNGKVPTSVKSANEEFSVTRVSGPAAAHETILNLVRANAIDFDQDLVLAPRNGEGEEPAPSTVKSLNADIQAIVNPHSGEKFVPGDRVMCTKNFSDKDVWNGTTGWIHSVDSDGVATFVSDEGNEMRLSDKERKDAIVPAYCLTVHKSQGSQYRNVYIVCLKRDMAVLMDRSMLYTAVTRARCACHILCDDGIDRVVGSVRRRETYLSKVMRNEI